MSKQGTSTAYRSFRPSLCFTRDRIATNSLLKKELDEWGAKYFTFSSKEVTFTKEIDFNSYKLKSLEKRSEVKIKKAVNLIGLESYLNGYLILECKINLPDLLVYRILETRYQERQVINAKL